MYVFKYVSLWNFYDCRVSLNLAFIIHYVNRPLVLPFQPVHFCVASHAKMAVLFLGLFDLTLLNTIFLEI